jgi:hypothetical protein
MSYGSRGELSWATLLGWETFAGCRLQEELQHKQQSLQVNDPWKLLYAVQQEVPLLDGRLVESIPLIRSVCLQNTSNLINLAVKLPSCNEPWQFPTTNGRKNLWIQHSMRKPNYHSRELQRQNHVLVNEINSYTECSGHCFHCHTLVWLQELWVDNSAHFPHVVAEMRLKITV